MDHALAAAARALASFDPLGALKGIALRDDPQALALRGVAMAQLGDYDVSRKLLGRAARGFEGRDPPARARCLAARAEVTLAARDLKAAGPALDEAITELEASGDRANALFLRLQRLRWLLLIGSANEARVAHRFLDLRKATPRLRALSELIAADLAVRRLDAAAAKTSLSRARQAANAAAIPALSDEVERAVRELAAPVAIAVGGGEAREVGLDAVASIGRSKDLVVDACRRVVRGNGKEVSLVTRPVLLAIAVSLGRVAPAVATRDALAEEAFGVKRTSESIRVRLRVEIGRLRRALAGIAAIEASGPGFAMTPRKGRVVVLLPPAPGGASALLALLRDGESWSTSALATAIGRSQRTVQRALSALRDEGRIEGNGRGRSQRWVARPPEGFATTLLLVTRPSDV